MYSDFISLVERDALGVEPRQMRRLHADALDAAEAVMEADLLRIRHVVASVPLGVGKLEGEKLAGRPGLAGSAGYGASSAVPAVVAAQLDAQRGAAAALPRVPASARAPVVVGAAGGPVTPPAGVARTATPAAGIPGSGPGLAGSGLGLGLGMAVDMSPLGGGADASAAMSFADLSSGSAMRSDR